MKRLTIILIVLFIGTMLWGQNPNPYDLIYWDFENTLEPEYVDDNIFEVSDIVTDESTTISFKPGTDGGNPRVGYIADTLFTTSEGFSPDNPPEKYIEFSFRPRWNHAVHLTSMEFRFGRNQLGPRAVVGQISLDGFQTASDPFWVANPIESENENSLDFFRVNFQGAAFRYRDANYKLTVRLYPIAAIEDQWDIVDPDDEDTWHTLMMNNFRVRGFVVPFPSIALALDRSGSMGSQQGGLNYWNGARQRIQLFVSDVLQLLDAVTIVTFNVEDMYSTDWEDHSNVDLPMRWPNDKISQIWYEPTDPDTVVVRADIIDAIDDIEDPVGRTSIGSGLKAAKEELLEVEDIRQGKAAIILLSDGIDNFAPFARDVVPDIPDHISVFCISLGPVANDALLAWIAAQTGGFYVHVANVNQLMTLYLEIYYRGIEHLQNNLSVNRNIAANDIHTHEVIVDNRTGHVKFMIATEEEDTSQLTTAVGFSLISPSGNVINAGNAHEKGIVTYSEGFASKKYEIYIPEPGKWRFIVTGNNLVEETNYVAVAYCNSAIKMDMVKYEDRTYRSGDQVAIEVSLTDDSIPIRSAEVTASIDLPSEDARNRHYSNVEGTPFANYEPEKTYDTLFQNNTRNPESIDVGLTEISPGVYTGTFMATETVGPYNISIRAVSNCETSAFERNDLSTFIILPPERVPPPTLAGPANEADSVATPVRFLWNDVHVADSYHFQLATVSEIIYDVEDIGVNYIDIESLEYDTSYSWRVKAIRSEDESESFWSAIWSFKTGFPEIPVPMNLQGSVRNDGIYLTWEGVPDEHRFYGNLEGYLVYRNDDLYSQTETDVTFLRDRNVLPGKTYTYYVVSVYDHDEGLTSEPSNIIQVTMTGIEGEDLLAPTGITGNYPNPFNPETAIHFVVEYPSFTRLTVYNIIGQKVRTLVGETLERGNHSVIWDARDENGKPVASGVYMLKMENDYYIGQRKILLLK